MELIHGGDVTGYRIRFGRPPLDFSASLNPLGMPAQVREAARLAVDDSVAYPDPLCRELRAALADQLGVPEDFFFVGNGAADVIDRFVRALRPKAALLPVPAFAEYERGLASVGCHAVQHPLRRENGFRLGDDVLAAITPDIDVVLLCQPNNPTGRVTSRALLLEIVRRAAAAKAVVLVDECFCRFVDDWESFTLVPYLREYDNLFILDSFTKLYAMAGIRLGYGITANRELTAKLYAAGQPWPVATIAQKAGLAALGATDQVEYSLKVIRDAKRGLVEGLGRFGFEVLGHDANYVFFYSPVPELDERLMEEGILIRNCRNFSGLGEGYYRVAVRLEEENARLFRALEKTLGGGDA